MDSNKKQGIMTGCLLSVILLVLGFFGFVALILWACGASVSVKETNNDAPVPDADFTSTWIRGDGDENSPIVVKVRMSGEIGASSPTSIFKAKDDSSSDAALLRIEAAAADESVTGLYLEIDTPGGGVTESDILAHAVEVFKASRTNRFVFVHMGDMCTSGGYYFAAPADYIMAHPTTLTGSIGVIMPNYNLSKLAEKLGVESSSIASGDNKDMLNPLKPVDPTHVAIMKKSINSLYDRFVSVVAKGRGLPESVIRPLADGRVFAAEDALREKLIDGIGYELDALAKIEEMAGGKVRIYRLDENDDSLKGMINDIFSANFSLGDAVKSLVRGEMSRPKYILR